MSIRKKRLFTMLAVLFGVVAGLFVAELVARLVMPRPLFSVRVDLKQFPRHEVDGVLLWEMRPPWYTAEDLEESGQNTNAFTIIGLGDSIMWGTGVERGDAYMTGLAQRLTDMTSQRVRVINMAQPAYNLKQEFTVFKEYGVAAKPDLILVHAWEDDLNQYLVVGGMLYNNVDQDKDMLHSLPLPEAANEFLVLRSRLYQLMSLHAERWQARRNIGAVSRREGRQLLKRLMNLAARHNAKVMFILSPALDKGAVRGFSPQDDPRHYFTLIQEEAAAHDAVVLDLGAELESIQGREIGVDLCHFNRKGNRLVREIIAQRISTEFLSGERSADSAESLEVERQR